MSEVAVIQPSSVLTVIERAATDPNIDIEKMERLLAMHERLLAADASKSYSVAMAGAQSEMRPISADANNPQTRSKYASYAKLDSALRPVYSKYGFALSFNTEESGKDDVLRVTCRVSHTNGHSERFQIDMPADGKGAKGGDVMTKTHATGAAATYGMRYLLKMIFNVAVGEDDTDGNMPKNIISVEQAAELKGMVEQTGADTKKLLAAVCPSAGSIDELPALCFHSARSFLQMKKRQGGAK